MDIDGEDEEDGEMDEGEPPAGSEFMGAHISRNYPDAFDASMIGDLNYALWLFDKTQSSSVIGCTQDGVWTLDKRTPPKKHGQSCYVVVEATDLQFNTLQIFP